MLPFMVAFCIWMFARGVGLIWEWSMAKEQYNPVPYRPDRYMDEPNPIDDDPVELQQYLTGYTEEWDVVVMDFKNNIFERHKI